MVARCAAPPRAARAAAAADEEPPAATPPRTRAAAGDATQPYFILTQVGATPSVYLSIGKSGQEAAVCSFPLPAFIASSQYAQFCAHTGYNAGGFTATWSAGTWVHVAVSYTHATGTATLYWNGAAAGARTSPLMGQLLGRTLRYSYLGRSQYVQDTAFRGSVSGA